MLRVWWLYFGGGWSCLDFMWFFFWCWCGKFCWVDCGWCVVVVVVCCGFANVALVAATTLVVAAATRVA